MCHISADGVGGENTVIQTTHTHRVSAPSVFLHKQNNETGSSTYFEERVPVPEEDSEVTKTRMMSISLRFYTFYLVLTLLL